MKLTISSCGKPITVFSRPSPGKFIYLIGLQIHRASASFLLIGCTWCQLQQIRPGHWSFFSPRTLCLACLTTIRSTSLFSIGQSGCRSAALSKVIGLCCQARDLYSVTCLAVRGCGLFLMRRGVPPLYPRSISRAERYQPASMPLTR